MPARPSPSVPRRTTSVLAVVLLLATALGPGLGQAGTSDDPESPDVCGDVDTLEGISDVEKVWWTYDTGGDRLRLHLQMCQDGSVVNLRRAQEAIMWVTDWTDADGHDWSARIWLTGQGRTLDSESHLRLCKDGVDVTEDGGGLAHLVRSPFEPKHWVVRIENGFATTDLQGDLTGLVTRAGHNDTLNMDTLAQDPRETCGAGFTDVHDRLPDAGTGAPFTVPVANVAASGPASTPTDPVAGDDVTFSATVSNDGSTETGSFDVAFEVDGTTTSVVSTASLAPGESRTVTSGTWTATSGDHTLRVVADATNDVREGDEQDNVVTTALPVADRQGKDLVATDLTVEPDPTVDGDDATFSATVRNVGTDETATTSVAFHVDGSLLGTASVPALSTYESVRLQSPTWTAAEGTHTAEAVADPDDVVAEADETNNTDTLSFDVIPPNPDLELVKVQPSPAVPGPGEETRFHATVENVGRTASDAVAVRFSADGSVLGDATLPALDAGETANVTSSAWSGSEGDHTARAEVDPSNVLDEMDETNNAGETAFPVMTWPSIWDADIRPGVVMHNGASQCTTSFVFSSVDNATLYIATASHCVSGRDLGDTVEINGEPAGRVAYCSWMHTENSDVCFSSPDGFVVDENDFALIEIKDRFRDEVNPAMLHYGGPTGVATHADRGDHVLTFGSSGLRPTNGVGDPREGYVVSRSGFTTTTYFLPPSLPGDSGSPSITVDGKALGTLSGLGTFPPASNSWVNVDAAVAYMEDRTDLDVELKTWSRINEAAIPVDEVP